MRLLRDARRELMCGQAWRGMLAGFWVRWRGWWGEKRHCQEEVAVIEAVEECLLVYDWKGEGMLMCAAKGQFSVHCRKCFDANQARKWPSTRAQRDKTHKHVANLRIILPIDLEDTTTTPAPKIRRL